MSIYKPSNGKPFLGSIDLTKKQIFQCELNTSNTPVTGYKIKILDNLNNIIFEGSDYSPLPIGNSGLNGSVLFIPVIVTAQAELTKNNIYYNTSNKKWYKNGMVEVSNFFNGYIHQPYKWAINLAQGDIFTSENVFKFPSLKWYDMNITSGKIMGSVPDRIQSKLSDNILKDYFIQLCEETFLEDATSAIKSDSFVGNRVKISRYDNSFGYIYPTEGAILPPQLYSASFFQIYKTTNDLKYINTNNLVDFATTVSLEDATITVSSGTKTSGPFAKLGNYYQQSYTGVSQSEAESFIPLASYYDGGASPVSMIKDTTRLLVKNQNVVGQSIINSSPLNGVYVYNSTKWEATNNGTLTIVWQRPSDANSWANLMGKIYYVQSGTSSGLNFESSATPNGVLNSTPLFFKIETPVELYPQETSWVGKNFGNIYKNTNIKTYVRPFIGLAPGMLFAPDNIGALTILNVDTDSWGISHDTVGTPLVSDINYRVTSFFKIGDENPFYAYNSPDIQIQSDMLTLVDDIYVLSKRYLTVRGIYNQAQNKSWKNFQWSLLNLNINHTITTDVSYSGAITTTFEGLQNNNRYQLTLTIEDELGIIQSSVIDFVVDIGTIPDGDFPLKVTFDCPTQSIDINFIKEGVIVPNYNTSNTGLNYSEGQMIIENATQVNEIAVRGFGVEYEKIDFKTDTGEIVRNNLSGPEINDMTINSQHILNPYFEGAIFEVLINMEDTIDSQNRIKVRGIMPAEIIYNNEGFSLANPDRNKIMVSYWQETSTNGTDWQKVLDSLKTANAIIIDGELRSDMWRLSIDTQDSVVAFGLREKDYIPSPKYDYLITDKAYNITVYQPVPGHINYRNLTTSIYNCSVQPIKFPLTAPPDPTTFRRQTFLVKKEDGVGSEFFDTANGQEEFGVRDYTGFMNLWADFPCKLALQADGTSLNVEDAEDSETNRWDENIKVGYVWKDAFWSNGPLYIQHDVNGIQNHSGRQNIANKIITFNISISNFDPTQTSFSKILDINRQCFIQNK